jgi:hypothetical protein
MHCIYVHIATFASSPRKIPKLSNSIRVAVFVKQLVEGGRDTLDVLTQKLNYVYVYYKQIILNCLFTFSVCFTGFMKKF